MNTFKIRLQDATHAEEFAGATAFVGEDASGSFGILARHEPIMTSLVIGLARFRIGTNAWQYLAMPRAVLYFRARLSSQPMCKRQLCSRTPDPERAKPLREWGK